MLFRSLLENLGDDDRVNIRSIYDAPCLVLVGNAQFMTALADARHGAGVGQGELFVLLEPTVQNTRLDACLMRKGLR